MDKQSDVIAILKLYELRTRWRNAGKARKMVFFPEFAPQNAMDILKLYYRGGERRASAYFRMVTS